MSFPQQNQIAYPQELTNSQKKKYIQTENQTYKDENGNFVYFIKLDQGITDDYRRCIDDIITTPKQNILTIYDICKHQNSFYLGTECQDGAKLLTNKLNDQEKKEAIIQIAKGLQELHQMSYTHRNVCPETIKYINGQWKLTTLQHVCDFVCVQYPPPVGLFNYHAPEYAYGKSYKEEIDIFALACVAYELFSSEKLFINPNEPRNEIPKRCVDKLNKMPPFIKEFIEQNFNNSKRSLEILLKDVNKFQDKQIDIFQTQSQSQVFDATAKLLEKQQPQCAQFTQPPGFKPPVTIMETIQSEQPKPQFTPPILNAEKRPSVPNVQFPPQNQSKFIKPQQDFQNPNTSPCFNPPDQKKGVQFPITQLNFTQNQKQFQPQQQTFSSNDQQSNQQQVKNNLPFHNFQNHIPPNNQQVPFNLGAQPEQQKKLLQGSMTLQNNKPPNEVNKNLLSEQYQDVKKQQEMEKQKKQQEEEQKQQREEEMKKQQEEEKKKQREEEQKKIEEEQRKKLKKLFNNVRTQNKGLSQPQK